MLILLQGEKMEIKGYKYCEYCDTFILEAEFGDEYYCESCEYEIQEIDDLQYEGRLRQEEDCI